MGGSIRYLDASRFKLIKNVVREFIYIDTKGV